MLGGGARVWVWNFGGLVVAGAVWGFGMRVVPWVLTCLLVVFFFWMRAVW